MSPVLEIESTLLAGSPRGRDSGLSGRAKKISLGLPSHAAP